MPLHLAVSILGVPSTISCSCPPLPRLPAPLCIPIQKWGGKRQRQKAPSSRSNSPSLRLPCRPSCSPISLNDASETRGRTRSGWRIWSAQHSNTEAEREREREGESGSFSRAALPKFKLKHRLLQFYIVSAVGRGGREGRREGGWSGGPDRPTETGRGGRPLPYYTRGGSASCFPYSE